MTPQEISAKVDALVKKYDGQFVEAGGSANAKNQCVDLANQYLSEFLGLPKVLWTNAVDFPARIGDKFEFIKNTPDGVPKKGALVIWDVPKGFGHISVFIKGTASKFTSFDENYPTYSSCHVQSHDYTGVIGWLQLREENTEMLQITKADFERIRSNSEKWDNTVKQLEVGTDPSTTPFEDVQRVIAGLKSRATDLQKQLTTAQAEATNAHDHVSRLETQLLSEKKVYLDAITNEKEMTKIAQNGRGQAEARVVVLQGEVETASQAKGAALLELANAKTEAQGYKDKYDQLLANKAKMLSFKDRIAVLFTGRIL